MTVIVLNGTSSSGKSSIAAELLSILDDTYYHLPRDAFNAMRARRPVDDEQLESILDKMVRGYHRAVAGMAATGNNVIADHVVRERSWALDLLDVLSGDVVLVGVRCPLPELIRRETERGDREPGIAARQYDRVHRDLPYDLTVDTSVESPRECALRVARFVESAALRRFEARGVE